MKRRGFTLVELLVVIAIIGLIAALSVIALGNARSKSRDSKRVADIKQIQTSLELFFSDNNRYPTIDEWNTGSLSTGDIVYMSRIPSSPSTLDGDCNESENRYVYNPLSDGQSYNISYCLGGSTGSVAAGNHLAQPFNASNVCDMSRVGDIVKATPGPKITGPYSVKVVDNYAYVASVGYGGNATNSIDIIDVSNPASPVYVSSFDSFGRVYYPEIVGNYIYVPNVDSGYLKIVDISNKANPVVVGTSPALGWGTSGVTIFGNYAYVGNWSSLKVLNISNPASPTLVTSYTTSASVIAAKVYRNGNYLYLMGNTNMEIVSIANPVSPVRVAIVTQTYNGNSIAASSIAFSGNYAYVTSISDSVEVFDVSNPAAPVNLGNLRNGTNGAVINDPYTVHLSGNYLYVASFYGDAVELVDISDRANPIHYASIGGSYLDGATGVYFYNSHAFAISYSQNALRVIRVCTE